MAGQLRLSVLASVLLIALGVTVHVHALAENVKQGQQQERKVIWVDVRTPAEFESGHLSEAINIEYQNIGLEITSIAPNKTTPINLYCRSGRRSEIARQTLLKMGYTNVINQGSYEMAKKK